MKKNVLIVFAVVAVFGLLLVEKFENSDKEDMAAKAGMIKELEYTVEREYEIVEAAAYPEEKTVVTIEEEDVPLAASFEEEPVSEEAAEDTTNVSKKAGKQKSTQPAQSAVSVESEIELTNLGNGIWGYYDDDAASALLSQVNKVRTASSGQSASALSAQLNSIARQRALSCVNDFSHSGMMTASECVAIGQQDATAVIAAWQASNDHKAYMTDPAYTQAGTACLWYDTGNGSLQSIWVLVLN